MYSIFIFKGIKGEAAQTSIHNKGQKGEPGLDGDRGMSIILVYQYK